MVQFDPSQLDVLSLDTGRHARVLGAPGTGKTTLIIESFVRRAEAEDWCEESVVVLSPNRLTASTLRAGIEHRAGRALGGTPVRTPTSLAFALLSREAAIRGGEQPRLLTGTVQDEFVAEVVDQLLTGDTELFDGFNGDAADAFIANLREVFPPEVLRSAPYRVELREMWRILDNFDVEPDELVKRIHADSNNACSAPYTRLPEPTLLSRWIAALRLISVVSWRIAQSRPDSFSSSAMMRQAARVIREHGAVVAQNGQASSFSGSTLRVPRLVLVDDAQELGEGELALLAACADVGASVWVFGDPDMSTGAFHGEQTQALSDLSGALRRHNPRQPARGTPSLQEQFLVLTTVHRHGAKLRDFVTTLTDRIGASGAGQQRTATACESYQPEGSVEFTTATSTSEQLGIIAHRLRARQLGHAGAPTTPWNEMAVICRNRSEAAQAARVLAGMQVPTDIAAGGLVLREHHIVRELIRLLQYALDIRPLNAHEVLQLLGGVVGGVDPVGVRRLRRELLLEARRQLKDNENQGTNITELIAEGFERPGTRAIVDSSEGRALRRLGLLAEHARQVRADGGTVRETLWAIWNGTGLASQWQHEALNESGIRADEANRSLDAVLVFFFALQRHEEQRSEQPINELLDELLTHTLPQDTLAVRAQRDAVTLTTPHGALGREFTIVVILGAQEGTWPNLRSRGSLLGTSALERWLRGEEAHTPSRQDTLHDELRLFAQSSARARHELLVVAVADEDQHPSIFFRLGHAHTTEGLPSSRLTLRGATATMRRRLIMDPNDTVALSSLVALAQIDAPGARPEEWYGILPPSTQAPIHSLHATPDSRIHVSPSQLEKVERCPLDWVISHLAKSRSSVQTSLGTLIHYALETSPEADATQLMQQVLSHWHKLPFEAEWESKRATRLAEAMTSSLAAYMREYAASGRQLHGSEARFNITIGPAVLRGVADRIEGFKTLSGDYEITVLDLKTGRSTPTSQQVKEHAQLHSYQLGVLEAAFNDLKIPLPKHYKNGGARLLYVHPEAVGGAEFKEFAQQAINAEDSESLRQRVTAAAEIMAASEFTARIEHHCSDPHQPGACRIHIISEVSNS